MLSNPSQDGYRITVPNANANTDSKEKEYNRVVTQ